MTASFSNSKGFTLIEVIVSLVILGIMGALAGAGFVQVSRGFLFARDTAATVGKAQAAMLRITKELTLVKSVSSGSATSISFTTKHGLSDVSCTLSLVDTQLRLDNDVLADSVSSFSLAYYAVYDGAASSSWSGGSRIIQVTMTLKGAENIDSTFTARIAPRNL